MTTSKVAELEIMKKKIQADIICSCISKSKAIIIANAAKQSLRNSEFFINRFPFLLPSERHIKEITDELGNKIFELKRDISISIRGIIGRRPIYIEDFFWFSPSDLKSGYVLLYPHTYTTRAEHVLFLVEARDTFDSIIYFPGDVWPFKQVNHVISSIKGLSDEELGIGFKYATKSDLLTELSTLSSIIKSKKHGSNDIKNKQGRFQST